MQSLFKTLHDISPILSIAYLVLFVIGASAPTIYCSTRKKVFSISDVLRDAKNGDRLAAFALSASGLLLLATSVLVIYILIG